MNIDITMIVQQKHSIDVIVIVEFLRIKHMFFPDHPEGLYFVKNASIEN